MIYFTLIEIKYKINNILANTFWNATNTHKGLLMNTIHVQNQVLIMSVCYPCKEQDLVMQFDEQDLFFGHALAKTVRYQSFFPGHLTSHKFKDK